MAAIGRVGEQLSRLSKAELIRRIETLRETSRTDSKAEIQKPGAGLALRDSEVLLRHAVQMANLGYWIWDDRENRCIYCSEQLARICGLTVEEYLSKHSSYGAWLDRIHPEDRERFDEVLSDAVRLKKPYEIEYRVRWPGSGVRYLREAGEPVLDDQGELAHTIGILQDITEAKRIEEALRESDARLRDQQQRLEQVSRLSALSQLSAALSREISEPRTAIMNYNAAARRIVKTTGLSDPDRIVGMLDKAIDQTRQANAVTRHLRDLFEKVDAEVAPQNINEIVDEALALIDPVRAGVHCELKLGQSLPEVRVNKIQIQQVVYNLIKNALEAMTDSDRREIAVETSLAAKGAVQVTVSDTGPGLLPAIEPRLFEPFATSKRNGLGLGLSISRGIIEGYGGRLWAEPNRGGGMRFCVTLPAVKPVTD